MHCIASASGSVHAASRSGEPRASTVLAGRIVPPRPDFVELMLSNDVVEQWVEIANSHSVIGDPPIARRRSIASAREACRVATADNPRVYFEMSTQAFVSHGLEI